MKARFTPSVLALADTLSLFLSSCKKESLESVNPAATVTASAATIYLKFSDADALKKAITLISKAPDKQAALQQVVSSYAVGTIEGEFQSLLAHPDKNPLVSNPRGSVKHQSLSKGATTNSGQSGGATTNSSVTTSLVSDETLADQMVPDPNLAAVLNDQLEIQVGTQIYRITPRGTFFTDAANKAALDIMVNDQTQDADDVDVESGTPIGGDVYSMGDGVSRYDTFGTAETVELQSLNGTSGGSITNGGTGSFSSACDIAQPEQTQYPTALTLQQYCSFPVYGYGAHTIAGRFLQGIFGVNSDRTENFDNNHRLKLKLYNFNYYVYSSIGVKAKFQKKGLFGIWGTMKAEKLVLGWDAVVFEAPFVYSQPNPQPVPSFPGAKVGQALANETYKFIRASAPKVGWW